MKIKLAIIISCLAGFVSISMEIIWFTVVGNVVQGHAGVFGMVLTFILLGIALGARYIYKRINHYTKETSVQLISNALLLGGLINFTGLPLAAWLMTYHIGFAAIILLNITAISALLGCIFPLLCHITVAGNEQNVGKQTSWIYAANIIGATAGPLLTGYVLVDVFPLKVIVSIFCIIPALLALLLNLSDIRSARNLKYIFYGTALALLALFSNNLLYEQFFEKVRFNTEFTNDRKFAYNIENRNGIISVEKTSTDFVFYGGGAYDGAINTRPDNNVNMISRAYMVSSLHPSPKRVLMIGLSTGSWAQVLSDFETIEELLIVEINPGYTSLLQQFPEVSRLLTNKKVKIIIDDGRRWLKLHEQEKFDLIVMNTSFHWREHITNLLSKDFLLICKKNLNPGGVMYWNTTSSPVVINTACNVFRHVTTYKNFVAASDAPFSMDYEARKKALLHFISNGDTVFYRNDSCKALLEQFATISLPDVRDSFLQQQLPVITDNNMASEYKQRVYKPRR
jgi:spermidine synthase